MYGTPRYMSDNIFKLAEHSLMWMHLTLDCRAVKFRVCKNPHDLHVQAAK
jgi:hypothetical protein